jgi:acyl-CoA hydrolase
VTDGIFTFVAIDANGKPRVIDAPKPPLAAIE